MKKQGYVANGAGVARATRGKQLHIRVTEDQLARYALAANLDGESLSRWAVALLDAASVPKGAKQHRARQQRRASAYDYGDDD
jgi:hypothetical protein